MFKNRRFRLTAVVTLFTAFVLITLVGAATRALSNSQGATLHLPIVPNNHDRLGTSTATGTLVATATETATATATQTSTTTVTQTATATATETATATATQTATATATQTPTATATVPTGDCPCDADVCNCSDFDYQAAAQACFEHCWDQTGRDVHRLDGNNDRIACNSLPCPCWTPSAAVAN